jgi:TldD protein
MRRRTRRSFLQTAACAGAASFTQVFPGVWLGLPADAAPGHFEREFGITDRLCAQVLNKALSKGGDFADLFFEHTVTNSVSLEDGKVDRGHCDIALGVGIRTVKGDQVGFGFTQELTAEAMLAAAATAATIADGSARDSKRRFERVKTKDFYPLRKLLTAVPLSSKLPLVQGVNDRCFSLSELVTKVSAGFQDSQKRILVVTSDGVKAEDLQPRNYLYASAVVERDGRKETGWWNLGGRRDFSYYTEKTVREVAETAVQRALVQLEAVQPPAGEIPVVLGPAVTGILLHEAIGHGMEADFNRKNISTYSTMIGKKVAEPFVTIIDDGTTPGLLGALNVDDEGVPGQKTVLVENGILTSYLHDRISARHYGLRPTGNGRRDSYQHYPLPRMRTTYMLGGQARPEDVIREAKNGIYVEDVANGQVKIGEGDFAFYVSNGRMIEEGRLTAPIKDVNIMGNGPKMLANVVMVANDMKLWEGGAGWCGKGGQMVPVSFGLPTCLVESMTVGGVMKRGA